MKNYRKGLSLFLYLSLKIPHALGFTMGLPRQQLSYQFYGQGYINHLATDEETILKVLSLDGDNSFT